MAMRPRPASAVPIRPTSFNDYDPRPVSLQEDDEGAFADTLSTGRPASAWGQDDPVRLYRHNEHFPGYTGHVPRLQQTHGTGYTIASRFALSAPPAPEKDKRPQQLYDQNKARRVLTAAHWLPGNSFSGYAKPTGEKGKGGANATVMVGPNVCHKYLQGSSVDVSAYYKSLAANDYKQLLIKSGSPAKARSHIDVGDRFYFNGPHMWQTTYHESYPKYLGKENSAPKEQLRPSTADSSSKLQRTVMQESMRRIDIHASSAKERSYQYKMLQAVVGLKRLDALDRQVRSKLLQVTNSGKHEALHMFKVFDKEGTGNISPETFHEIAKSLGIHLTATEAAALFGRYDMNSDEEISFYEFLDHFVGEQGKNSSYY